MEKFQDKVCVLICWALMVMHNTAERQYFTQNSNMTWNEARNYCQVCFKDLVTLNHDNIEMIVKMISSQHWIGLRKSFNSTSNYTGNTTMSWSHWSNGEPITYQNWYPGWPLFKPSVPDNDCCGCSCNGPAATTPTMSSFTDITDPNGTDFTLWGNITDPNGTDFTLWGNITDNMTITEDYMNITSTVFTDTTLMMTTPLPTTAVSETGNGYIEDSCVAMFSFGPWVEKDCSELLPFICYEDHSSGYFKVNVSNVTTESATVTWQEVPDGISRYHVVVEGGQELTDTETNLTYDLVNLTAGTFYKVHVFPIKCERDMNPESVAFYTKPNKVENLTVTEVTETSIQVNWSKPAGNLDFYRLRVGSWKFDITTEGKKVDGLTPGSLYTLTVRSGVKDYSRWSEESTITEYTKPSKVSNLSVSNNAVHSVFLSWGPPEGNYTGFLVKALNSADDILFDDKVNQSVCEVLVKNLTMGTKITLVVIAQANGSLEGDNTTIFTYTEPGPISNLTVNPSHNSLYATWTFDGGEYSNFTAELQLDGKLEEKETNLKEARVTFDNLKTAANYTVVVYAVRGHLNGSSMEVSSFTLPSPPTNAIATFFNKNTITFNWTAPENIAKVTYRVKLNSSFYGQDFPDSTSETSYTFSNLMSGTKYYFQVSVVGGGLESEPANCTVTTETDEIQVSLSMLCSSATPLLCDNNDTRKRVSEQLKDHFKELLDDYVVWDLVPTEA